jgi:hypothetical protein
MAAETAALVAVYQMPTANLDVNNIDQAFSDAQSRFADLNSDWLPSLVTDALSRVKGRLDDGGLPTDPAATVDTSRAQLTAVAEVHRVCAGWDSPASAPNEAANGAVDVTAIIDSGQLNSELWATATACHARFPPADGGSALGPVTSPVINATLDGTLIIYLLGPLPRFGGSDVHFLVSFSGMIGVGDQVRSTSFDFVVDGTTISFRVAAGGGDAIVTVGTTFGIAGANAGFSCDFGTLTCQQTS